MLPFNEPLVTGKENAYIQEVLNRKKISGDGDFTGKCSTWFEDHLGCRKALLTTSGTHALEMAALLADIQPADEIIMPSYTFVSTANAFVLRGAIIVFVDIRPDTMNIDESRLEEAITSKTRAIVPVHYGGVACEMDTIMEIAARHNLLVIEDAAQGMMSEYKGKDLGTIGHLGCYSFHESKNYNCGEGGLLIINDDSLVRRAEIIREKGTNRSEFFRGQADKYTWMDIGSSYLPSELNAACLYAQLEVADHINARRLQLWRRYYEGLKPLAEKGRLVLPHIPEGCRHNAHMFFIKVKDGNERQRLIRYLQENGVMAVFHYIPLHSSPAGRLYGRFSGHDKYTTRESERLLRLPMYYNLEETDVDRVVALIGRYYERDGS
ncbi:dTDP-4-amino-4,6-dideoxygalactose transaminase [Syntrophomonas palmitatica]|uniref:dTDP-4-amino-4,6-dideoxygalactose transaminase n=1 Tax=Syntrophomonas palmitatica TaxID=402877 RepID=UPI0006D0534B|nr:dTDP-4-amino-4,6-dideoxygalactose transaminase [Syntrophomonas palmitatica]